jgi:hypothetical protein
MEPCRSSRDCRRAPWNSIRAMSAFVAGVQNRGWEQSQ